MEALPTKPVPLLCQTTESLANQCQSAKDDIRRLPTELRLKVFKHALLESTSNSINPALALAFSANRESKFYKEVAEIHYGLPWIITQNNFEHFNSLPTSTLEQIKHIVFQLPLSPEIGTPKLASDNNLETVTLEFPRDGSSMSSCANASHIIGMFLEGSPSVRRFYVRGLADIEDDSHHGKERWSYLEHYLKALKFRKMTRKEEQEEGDEDGEEEAGKGVTLECDVGAGRKEFLTWRKL